MTKDEEIRLRRLRVVTYWLFALVAAVVIVVMWLYLARVSGSPFDGKADAGQFGDYMGGLLNPIVALFALAALFESLNVQRQELAETREELRETRLAAQRQADHFELQGKLDELSRAAGMLQTSLDSALSAPLRVGSTHRRGDHVPVVFTANLEDSLGWCLALSNSPENSAPPHSAENAQNVGEMLLGKSNSLPPEVWTQGIKVVDLLKALANVLKAYNALAAGAALPTAYHARYGPIVNALRIAGAIGDHDDVASEFGATPPEITMPTTPV